MYILKFLCLLFIFTSCLKREDKVRTVKAYVYNMNYRHSYITHSWTNHHMHTNYHPARYYITFSFNDSNEIKINNKDVYEQVKLHDSIDIEYYNLIDSKGVVKDFEFKDLVKNDF